MDILIFIVCLVLCIGLVYIVKLYIGFIKNVISMLIEWYDETK